MQPFACVEAACVEAGSATGGAEAARTVYMPLHGFTAVDLGYQLGNAVSNLINKMDEPPFTATDLQLLGQIWHDTEKVEAVRVPSRPSSAKWTRRRGCWPGPDNSTARWRSMPACVGYKRT